MKYTCSMETVQQNVRFTLFSSKFHSKYVFYSLCNWKIIIMYKKNQLSNGCNQYKWLNNGPKADFEMLPALQTAKCKFLRLCYLIDPLHNLILSCYKWFVFSTRSYKWKRVRCNFRFGFEVIIKEIVNILVHREIF